MKTKIKYILIVTFFTSILLFNCKKEVSFDTVQSTNINFKDSSALNPKNALYQDLINKYVKKGLPGLVVLIRTPQEGLWVGSAGYSCIEENKPMEKGSIVYSASIGKTYCAVAIMLLYEEGKIDLDDNINKYLSKDICDNIPNGNKATIKQLLGHTAGIPNVDSNPKFIADGLNDPFSIRTDDLLKYEYGTKPLFEPGNGYKYSSTGYEMLAKIIDKVTGEHHSKYYTSHIFKPLGLINTYYKNEPGFPKPNGLVNSYLDRLDDGKLENISDINNHITAILTGSDGIMASIYDYHIFVEALFKGNLLSQKSRDLMTTWRDTYSWSTSKYGLGLQRRETKYGYMEGHDGDAVGAAADMFYFPEHDITVVTATNAGTFFTDTKMDKLYNDEFKDELLDIVFK